MNQSTEQIGQQVADEQRVKLGAAFLDEKRCGWWDEDSGTDLDTLDMGDDLRCVLGQEYGCYETAWHKLADLSDPDWADRHGFEAEANTDRRVDTEYEALTAEWRRVIEARRSAV